MFNLPDCVTMALSLLYAAGFEGYIVGGCVRDLLMGREVHDWDLTTNAVPQEVAAVFRDYKVVETGISHGTVTVLTGSTALEITTYRIDSEYSDNRHPDSVSFSRSIGDDLARRDFTINAIAYSTKNGLVDMFGGQKDIKKGVIRCVGDASKRFDEDALRILRALRFASTLGFTIDEDTATAIMQKRELLKNISAERINVEITKLLCGGGAGQVLRDYRNVLAVPVPELSVMFGFDQKNRHHCYDVWIHTVVTIEALPQVLERQSTEVLQRSSKLPYIAEMCSNAVLYWSALFHDIGKPASFTTDEHGEGHFYGHAPAGCEIADTVMRRLRFDNASRERILQLVKYHDVTIGTDEKRVKRLLGRFGEQFVRQLTALKRADNLAQSEDYRDRQDRITEVETLVEDLIARQECMSLRDLAVNGDDLLALGYTGRTIGNALQMLLDAVIDELVLNERAALLDWLEESGL